MILIIYDSRFGNTEKIALMLSDALTAAGHQTMALKVGKITSGEIKKANLIVLGSPTHAFHVTEAMEAFLKENLVSFSGHKVAIFDTRMDPSRIKSKMFHVMVKRFGFACDYLAKRMRKARAKLVVPLMPFNVVGGHGPLADGTDDQILDFAKKLAQADQ